MKTCCHCKQELSLDSFQKNRVAPDGYNTAVRIVQGRRIKSAMQNVGTCGFQQPNNGRTGPRTESVETKQLAKEWLDLK